jgi:hypothetical protein
MYHQPVTEPAREPFSPQREWKNPVTMHRIVVALMFMALSSSLAGSPAHAETQRRAAHSKRPPKVCMGQSRDVY